MGGYRKRSFSRRLARIGHRPPEPGVAGSNPAPPAISANDCKERVGRLLNDGGYAVFLAVGTDLKALRQKKISAISEHRALYGVRSSSELLRRAGFRDRLRSQPPPASDYWCLVLSSKDYGEAKHYEGHTSYCSQLRELWDRRTIDW
jgi:hypothetical protein